MSSSSSSKTVLPWKTSCVFGGGNIAGSTVRKVPHLAMCGDFTLFMGCNIFTFCSLLLVGTFPTELVSPHSEFICKSYSCVFGVRTGPVVPESFVPVVPQSAGSTGLAAVVPGSLRYYSLKLVFGRFGTDGPGSTGVGAQHLGPVVPGYFSPVVPRARFSVLTKIPQGRYYRALGRYYRTCGTRSAATAGFLSWAI